MDLCDHRTTNLAAAQSSILSRQRIAIGPPRAASNRHWGYKCFRPLAITLTPLADRGVQFLQLSQIRTVKLDSAVGQNSVAALNSSEYILRRQDVSSAHEAETRLGSYSIDHRSLCRNLRSARIPYSLSLNSLAKILGYVWVSQLR